MNEQRRELAFETVIEAHLLANGYVNVERDGFDRERAIFPEAVLAFIRETQPSEWAKLEALHGERTGEERAGEAACSSQADSAQRPSGLPAAAARVDGLGFARRIAVRPIGGRGRSRG